MDRDHINNYLSVAIALSFTCDGLNDFIINTIKAEHKKILRKLPRGVCNENCSRKHGNDFKQWCIICKVWKDELCELHRYKRQWTLINWKEFDTIDFRHATPNSFEAMAKLFVKHDTGVGLFNDISAIMSLLINMKCFNVDRSIIKGVQDVRNKHNAHNNTASVNDVDKILCIDKLITLLRVPAIYGKRSAKKALPILAELKSSDDIPESVLLQDTTMKTLILIENNIVQKEGQQNKLVSVTCTFRQMLSEYTHKYQLYYQRASQKRDKLIKYLGVGWLMLNVLLLITLLVLHFGNKEKHEGCLSITFNEHWQNELDFDFYLNALHNESFIERVWLKQTIEEQLASDSSRGVLITADMGFGKSSLVSNILCAEKSSAWYSLKQDVLMYHFCRYDVSLSLNSDVFIRNLAGAIVKRYPTLGKLILANYKANLFLYGTHCSKNPVLCLENAILDPLKDQWGQRPFYIIVDALDECSSSVGSGSLLNLLYTQIDKFPTNVKFVFTTRRIENIYKQLKHMAIVDLNHTNEKCHNDIKTYVQKVGDGWVGPKQMDTLAREVKGNFLLIKQYLNSCLKSSDCRSDQIPQTLEQLYEFNFVRVFQDKMEVFEELLPIFAVLCATERPLTENEAFLILNMSNTENKRKIQRLLRNELGHFVKICRGEISFIHKSFQDFLTDENRRYSDFFIDLKEGHSLLANYYLKVMNSSFPSNVVTLVHHVAMSQKYDYKELLFDMEKNNQRGSSNLGTSSLLGVVQKYNSYLTVELFIKLTNPKDLNVLDNHNLTAAFLAASNGHHESLRCLLDYGANPHFKVRSWIINDDKKHTIHLSVDIKSRAKRNKLSGQELVFACKNIFFCGYTLMHIAAQNGHANVIRLLVKRHRELIFEKNQLNLNAFHVASENGYHDIVQILLNSHKNFADTQALYQASRNGHITVVRSLLNHGVKDTCLPCNGSFYWLPPFAQRLQKYFDYDTSIQQKSEIKFVFYDDRRLITCETALNVAIQNGHESIVHELLRQSVNTLNCRMYDGKTPLMTAVRYNRDDLFRDLYLKGSSLNARCFKLRNLTKVQSMFSKSEFEKLTSEKCPTRASVFHLLAAYGNDKLLLLAIKKMKISFENHRDANLATPLHYAFCHGNFMYITIVNKTSQYDDLRSYRSKNGSTPFHSAAICFSRILYLRNKFEIYGQYATDYSNRSILQYGLINCASRQNLRDCQDLIIYAIKHNHDLYHTDNDRRNFLHYAAKTGIYFAVQLAEYYGLDLIKLLGQKDKGKRTPLDEAFYSLRQRHEYDPVKIPINCDIKEMFYDKRCKTDFESILSKHETFISETARQNDAKTRLDINMREYIELALQKRSIFAIIILKTYFGARFLREVFYNWNIIQFAINEGLPVIAELFLFEHNALHCNGGFSPLHKIIFNDDNRYGGYSSVKFLDKYLSTYKSEVLDGCFDKEGYNLLHRAVLGGNLIAVKYLIRKGMTMSLISRSGFTPLYLLLQKAPFHHNGILPAFYIDALKSHTFHYMNGTSVSKVVHTKNKVKFEETAIFLLRSNARALSVPGKCHPGSNLTKIIHLAAAKGFLKFLKVCKSLFGLEILNCRDHNNVTVHFLANLYNQTEISHWIRNDNIDNALPRFEITKYLIYNLITNYRSRSKMDWLCYTRIHFRHSALIRNQVKKCLLLATIYESAVLFRSNRAYGNTAYQLNELVSMFYPKTPLILTAENLHHCEMSFVYKTTFRICSDYILIENIARRHQHRLADHIYAKLQLVVTFGPFDKTFIFRILTMHFKFKNYENDLHDITFFNTFWTYTCANYTYLSMLRMGEIYHRQWRYHFSAIVLQERNIGLNDYEHYDHKNIERYIKEKLNLYKIYQELERTIKLVNEKVVHHGQPGSVIFMDQLISLWEGVFDAEDLLESCDETDIYTITYTNKETISTTFEILGKSASQSLDIRRKIKHLKKIAHHILKLLRNEVSFNKCLTSFFFVANEVIKIEYNE